MSTEESRSRTYNPFTVLDGYRADDDNHASAHDQDNASSHSEDEEVGFSFRPFGGLGVGDEEDEGGEEQGLLAHEVSSLFDRLRISASHLGGEEEGEEGEREEEEEEEEEDEEEEEEGIEMEEPNAQDQRRTAAEERERSLLLPIFHCWRSVNLLFLIYWVPLAFVLVLGLLFRGNCCNDCFVKKWVIYELIGICVCILQLIFYMCTPASTSPSPRNGLSREFFTLLNFLILRVTQLFLFVWWIVGLITIMHIEGDAIGCSVSVTATIVLIVELLSVIVVFLFGSCCCCLCVCTSCIVCFCRKRRGASEGEIRKLPTKVYECSETPEDCSICYATFEEGEELRVLPCSHYYHSECIDQWLPINSTCPICRAPINPEQEDDEAV